MGATVMMELARRNQACDRWILSLLRAFTTRNVILLYFTISKSYFIYCTISFYNIPNIPSFIFLYNILK